MPTQVSELRLLHWFQKSYLVRWEFSIKSYLVQSVSFVKDWVEITAMVVWIILRPPISLKRLVVKNDIVKDHDRISSKASSWWLLHCQDLKITTVAALRNFFWGLGPKSARGLKDHLLAYIREGSKLTNNWRYIPKLFQGLKQWFWKFLANHAVDSTYWCFCGDKKKCRASIHRLAYRRN